MDLHMIAVFLLRHFFLLILYNFRPSQAHYPVTGRYPKYFGEKEPVHLHKQRSRHEPISLKPPPPDWPAPPGISSEDYNMPTNPPTLSPLQIYQAKLQQEYYRQRMDKQLEDLQREALHETDDKTKESSVWSSSEEDFKKLLEPDELLKHNKQLGSVLSYSRSKQKSSEKEKSAKKQGKMKKPVKQEVEKVKLAKSSRKVQGRDTKSSTKEPSRRGRKRKQIQGEYSEYLTPLKELKKHRQKSKNNGTSRETIKTKRRKKTRKFSFATKYSKETEDKSTIIVSTKIKSSEEITSTPKQSLTTSTKPKVTTELISFTNNTTEEPKKIETKLTGEFIINTTLKYIINATTEKTLTTEKDCLTNIKSCKPYTELPITISKTTENLRIKTSNTTIKLIQTEATTYITTEENTTKDVLISLPKIAENLKIEESTINIKPTETEPTTFGTTTENTIKEEGVTENIEETYNSEKTSTIKSTIKTELLTTIRTTLLPNAMDKRAAIKERRKQLRREMKNVLKAEQLDGSFSDKEANWTTSEKMKRIPISNVTPRQALLGIIKHKIMDFVHKIVKDTPKLTDEQRQLNEEKFTRWNSSYDALLSKTGPKLE